MTGEPRVANLGEPTDRPPVLTAAESGEQDRKESE
jgi:hypothetical protein